MWTATDQHDHIDQDQHDHDNVDCEVLNYVDQHDIEVLLVDQFEHDQLHIDQDELHGDQDDRGELLGVYEAGRQERHNADQHCFGCQQRDTECCLGCRDLGFWEQSDRNSGQHLREHRWPSVWRVGTDVRVRTPRHFCRRRVAASVLLCLLGLDLALEPNACWRPEVRCGECNESAGAVLRQGWTMGSKKRAWHGRFTQRRWQGSTPSVPTILITRISETPATPVSWTREWDAMHRQVCRYLWLMRQGSCRLMQKGAVWFDHGERDTRSCNRGRRYFISEGVTQHLFWQLFLGHSSEGSPRAAKQPTSKLESVVNPAIDARPANPHRSQIETYSCTCHIWVQGAVVLHALGWFADGSHMVVLGAGGVHGSRAAWERATINRIVIDRRENSRREVSSASCPMETAQSFQNRSIVCVLQQIMSRESIPAAGCGTMPEKEMQDLFLVAGLENGRATVRNKNRHDPKLAQIPGCVPGDSNTFIGMPSWIFSRRSQLFASF